MEKNEHKRDGFRSRSGFIIACIGSAVGMENRSPVKDRNVYLNIQPITQV